MKALRLVSYGSPGSFEFVELPDLKPGLDEVVVNVRACGLNRLDLWFEENQLPVPVPLPRIPGCEIAGVISALGEDVDEWQIGDRVAVQSNLFCGECEFCLRGEESSCLHGLMLGVQRDGGFASEVVVPWNSLVKLPAGVDFQTSAALTLAGSTAMHMLTDRVEIHPGDWVLVIAGASGVGSAAIQIAKQLGARIISTGSTADKQALALQLGADYALDATKPSWNQEVRKITNKRGVDFVIEHVGGDFLEQCFHCLARGGSVVTCGATGGRSATLNLWPFFVKQQRLIGSYGRNRTDLAATIEWAQSGRLRPVVDQVFPLSKALDAYNKLRSRQTLGKVVIIPD